MGVQLGDARRIDGRALRRRQRRHREQGADFTQATSKRDADEEDRHPGHQRRVDRRSDRSGSVDHRDAGALHREAQPQLLREPPGRGSDAHLHAAAHGPGHAHRKRRGLEPDHHLHAKFSMRLRPHPGHHRVARPVGGQRVPRWRQRLEPHQQGHLSAQRARGKHGAVGRQVGQRRCRDRNGHLHRHAHDRGHRARQQLHAATTHRDAHRRARPATPEPVRQPCCADRSATASHSSNACCARHLRGSPAPARCLALRPLRPRAQ